MKALYYGLFQNSKRKITEKVFFKQSSVVEKAFSSVLPCILTPHIYFQYLLFLPSPHTMSKNNAIIVNSKVVDHAPRLH